MNAGEMIQAGAFREVITLQEPVVTGKSASGEPEIMWIPRGNFRAQVEELSGRELYSAQQISADITTRFTIRRQDISFDETWRIAWRGNSYDLKPAVATDTQRSEIEIMAVRRPRGRNT